MKTINISNKRANRKPWITKGILKSSKTIDKLYKKKVNISNKRANHEPWITKGILKSSKTLDKLYKKSLNKVHLAIFFIVYLNSRVLNTQFPIIRGNHVTAKNAKINTKRTILLLQTTHSE